MPIRVIAFDADDTLWINETYFREAEEKFASLLEDFLPQHAIMKELYRTEIANLSLSVHFLKAIHQHSPNLLNPHKPPPLTQHHTMLPRNRN